MCYTEPELRAFPDAFLDQPEKTPLAVQAECGVRIGETYPYPTVEYEAARERTVRQFEAVTDDAEAALRRPDVARRASLSRRGGASDDAGETEQNDGTDSQSSLSEFG